ncbi:MAG: A/G-specific adenine glycosylase [Erysipelotrichia bacterium]|nr:A/G-specific adenine glycosylase [Erysipelotrichia bacterium]
MSENNQITAEDALSLTEWFRENKRDLPWRDTGNPYDVWLSEIMLQQTRVEFVRERFVRFKQALPDIASLAQCPPDRLMKLWEGMGYYSRARNLQKCAIQVMEQHGGQLPEDCSTLKKLPGIGPYTAGAISAIAFHHAVPAVDGNVLRVLARRFAAADDIRQAAVRIQFESDIQQFYQNNAVLIQQTPSFPSLFTQALMELGALVCVPNGEPHCSVCPWQNQCLAAQKHLTDSIPVRSSLQKRRIIDRTLLIIRDGSRFLLHKRQNKGLLANLYEFYGVDQNLTSRQAVRECESLGFSVMRIHRLPDSKHIFTHLEWHMTAYEIQVADLENFSSREYCLADVNQLKELAIPSAFHAYKDYYMLK